MYTIGVAIWNGYTEVFDWQNQVLRFSCTLCHCKCRTCSQGSERAIWPSTERFQTVPRTLARRATTSAEMHGTSSDNWNITRIVANKEKFFNCTRSKNQLSTNKIRTKWLLPSTCIYKSPKHMEQSKGATSRSCIQDRIMCSLLWHLHSLALKISNWKHSCFHISQHAFQRKQ